MRLTCRSKVARPGHSSALGIARHRSERASLHQGTQGRHHCSELRSKIGAVLAIAVVARAVLERAEGLDLVSPGLQTPLLLRGLVRPARWLLALGKQLGVALVVRPHWMLHAAVVARLEVSVEAVVVVVVVAAVVVVAVVAALDCSDQLGHGLGQCSELGVWGVVNTQSLT